MAADKQRPTKAEKPDRDEVIAAAAAASQEKDHAPVTILAYQAQELLDFLGECPAARVYHLIGYLLSAKS